MQSNISNIDKSSYSIQVILLFLIRLLFNVIAIAV